MDLYLTQGAARALEEAANWSLTSPPGAVTPPAMLLGLLTEPECGAAVRLRRHNVARDKVLHVWPSLERNGRAGTLAGGGDAEGLFEQPPPAEALSEAYALFVEEQRLPPIRFSPDMLASLAAMVLRLEGHPRPFELTTEHFLMALLAAEHQVTQWLTEQGLCLEAVQAELDKRFGVTAPDTDPLDLPPLDDADHETAPPTGFAAPAEPPATPSDPPASPPALPAKSLPAEQFRALRVIDAASNRSREGMRVVEDYVRFVLDDRHLTAQLKQARHDLASLLAQIPSKHRIAARETQTDVGTSVSTAGERSRDDVGHVLHANFTRVQESLRSLEEFSKVLNPALAVGLEQLRYRVYTLHRAAETTRASIERLAAARLYVLLDGGRSESRFVELTQSLVDAGVHVLQLRDKKLDDRSLLARARQLRELTRSTPTLFIVNDRPDIAALSDADGVHVGQEELTVKDVRTMLGPEALVGVSTHSIEQARTAVMDGANYIGVGPTFPSQTKEFRQFPGLELLRQVAAEIRLPAFAIGGLEVETLPQVLATGTGRVALSRAVVDSPDPVATVVELLGLLGG